MNMNKYDVLMFLSVVNAAAMVVSAVFLKNLSLILFFVINLFLLILFVLDLGKLSKDDQRKLSTKCIMMILIPSICGVASIILKKGI